MMVRPRENAVGLEESLASQIKITSNELNNVGESVLHGFYVCISLMWTEVHRKG